LHQNCVKIIQYGILESFFKGVKTRKQPPIKVVAPVAILIAQYFSGGFIVMY
jgi:hypothetical protein